MAWVATQDSYPTLGWQVNRAVAIECTRFSKASDGPQVIGFCQGPISKIRFV